MMLKRGLADADDAWAWGWLRLRMLGKEPADVVCSLMLMMLGPVGRLMLMMLKTRPG